MYKTNSFSQVVENLVEEFNKEIQPFKFKVKFIEPN